METNENGINSTVSPYHSYVNEDIRLADLISITDSLTGLGNLKYIEQKMQTVLNGGMAGQLWVIDVDAFEKIQSEKGMLFADEVLCDVARTLSFVFEDGTAIGRNRWDEFLVLTVGHRTDEELEKQADELNQSINMLYKQERIFCDVTVSIGITRLPKNAAIFDEVLAEAEKAVSYVKNCGGSGFAFFQSRFTDRHQPRENKPHRRFELFEMLPKENATEYNFKLLADTKDSESAVNLLMKRSLDYYNVDHCLIYMAQEDGVSIRCEYEGRRDRKLSLFNDVIEFSKRGWDNRLERMRGQDSCSQFDRLFFGEGYLSKSFSVFPPLSTFMRAMISANDVYVGDIYLVSYSGEKVWSNEDKQNLEAFTNVLGYYLMARRAPQQRMVRDKLEGIDTLTGLYTLDTFLNIAEEYVNGSNDQFALVYLDIGNFKSINRECGYDVGDRVLREFARLLKGTIKDVVASGRIYGDKFAVLCREGMLFDEEQIMDNAYRNNCLLQDAVHKICRSDNILVHSGLYHIPPGVEMSVALSRAKMAKNIAKHQWTNHLVIYEEWMSDSAQRNYELIGNVDKAIDEHEFVVYLQPKVNSRTMQIVGAEALVRWVKKDGTMVFPDEFIPVFEKNGKIIDIDYYVYEEVFRYLRKRLDEGKQVVPISMNVSRVHLSKGHFIKKVTDLMEMYQVPSEFLEFELTENVYVENLQEAMPFIENIRKKRIKVSIDDFGSGYSSLNVISSIPLDVLKLDKAFMKKGGELTPKDRAIIAHLVELAKDIELEVLCEGVETQIQADFVKEIGCTAWQGYCFAKPMSMEAFDECLDAYCRMQNAGQEQDVT